MKLTTEDIFNALHEAGAVCADMQIVRDFLNASLAALLKDAQVVYGDGMGVWSATIDRDESGVALDDHRARLVNIEKMEKGP
jgi:hypothetical protein